MILSISEPERSPDFVRDKPASKRRLLNIKAVRRYGVMEFLEQQKHMPTEVWSRRTTRTRLGMAFGKE